jgi:hypothetical protein
VGKPHQRSRKIEFVFLDFEKSVALRPQPLVSSTMLPPRQLWPSGELGLKLRRRKPLRPPQSMLDRISSISANRCAQLIDEVTVCY